VVEAVWQQATTVAIKKLHMLDAPALEAWGVELTPQERASVLASLIRECHTNDNIRHPNIVQFLGVVMHATTQEPCMLMMEYMSGGSLASLLYGSADDRQAPIDTRRQVSIMIDVCCALQYLHSRQPPILHLDIKPDNIMLDGTTGRAKLGDLGEAHIVQSVTHRTTAAAAAAHALTIGTTSVFGVGTELYMAPEMRHEDEQKSSRTDMFSMGVVMCEMSAGRRPSPGPEMERVDQWLSRHVPEEERRAADIGMMRDQQVRDIVEHLIVDEMADRWSAQQVLASLQRVMNEL
jgi:serine/threonine protein kinase